MPQVDLNFYQLLGYGASLICILLLLSLNDRRYGTQIDNIWYIIFSVLLWILFQSARKKAKIVVVALLAANLILLILYVRLLPPFTYKAALRELSSQYPEIMLPSSWDRKNQSLAPYYPNEDPNFNQCVRSKLMKKDFKIF